VSSYDSWKLQDAESAGFYRFDERDEEGDPMLTVEELNDDDAYDWREAFAYAGKDRGNGEGVPMLCAGADCSAEPFGRADVATIIAAVDGENDGPEWLICGRLKDGRWFALSAGCDYTGWDCQAGGQAWVSDTKANLIAFGLSDEARRRLDL
jgi:hypothetical protein